MKANHINPNKQKVLKEANEEFDNHFKDDYINVLESEISLIDGHEQVIHEKKIKDKRDYKAAIDRERDDDEAISHKNDLDAKKVELNKILNEKAIKTFYKEKRKYQLDSMIFDLNRMLNVFDKGSQLFKSTEVLIELINSEKRNLI